jgi:uncharacterized protein (DUF302 family)
VSYYTSKTLQVPFEDALARVTEALKAEGFGILTEIDDRETLRKKLDIEFRPYKILGAFNPPFSYQALQAEEKIGTMRPCNVIVQDKGAEGVEVAGVDPIASMQAVENSDLVDIAEQVQAKLRAAIETL